jgi:two-component system chemotaxis sensor kinase CheA
MSFFDDEEILEDFLVEAGEILELLSEQLVQLEKQPDDKNLLNAIFRGFHTVKGGAGFLQLGAMVDCCHVTENLFDNLRNGKQTVSPALMDIVLQALDAVNVMFDSVKLRQTPAPAPAALLDALSRLARGEQLVGARPAPEPAVPVEEILSDNITEDEFDRLLATLDYAAAENPTGQTDHQDSSQHNAAEDEITEAEFEALLDQMQGKSAATKQPEPPAVTLAMPVTDEISDDEFEALLDQLHGGGVHRGVPTAEVVVPASAPAIAQANSKPFENSAVPASSASKSTVQPLRAAPVPERAESKEPAAETTVRVDTRRLDDIMNMVGELVLVRNRLVRIGSNSADEMLSKAVANLDLVTADLQTSVMKTRMQPIKKVFGRFPRVVRDLARSLNKEVILELHGEETDLDKNLVEALADPLVHLVRNAVDHGIEQPEKRLAKGKCREGTILLAAEQEGDHILLTISDDGNGMDPELLRRKAVEKGLMDKDAADRLTRTECFDLIFAPGFSTKTEVSDVSGRGVGMDVVKTKIAQLNGTVFVDSTLGKGSRIEIKVPLTLAIMPTMMILVGDQTFALPLASVNEIFNLSMKNTHIVDGQQVVTVRDKALPLFHLRRWLSNKAGSSVQDDGTANVVIVSIGAQRVGFVVDTLIGQEEVVIKPLGRMLHGTTGMAGATITGDGRIAIILDVPGLLKKYAA